MYPILICAVMLDVDWVCSFFLPSHRFIFLAGSYLAWFVHSVFLTSLSFCLHHAPEYIWTLIPQSFLAPKSSTKAVAKMTAPSQQQKPILFFICYWLITYIYIFPTNHSVVFIQSKMKSFKLVMSELFFHLMFLGFRYYTWWLLIKKLTRKLEVTPSAYKSFMPASNLL